MNNCNCGAQDGPEHRPHSNDCAVYGNPEQPFDDFDTQRQVEEEYPDDEDPRLDGPEDHFRDDVEADADVLRSAGFGTDEDYGLYGDGGFF